MYNKFNSCLILVFILNLKLARIYTIKTNDNFNPRIDTNEINNFKYHIDIENPVQSKNTNEKNNQNNKQIIQLKTVHGQTYQCELPNLITNQYDDGEEEEEEDEELNNQSPLNVNHEKKSYFNFTLINEKIENYLDDLKKSNICIYKNMGWWTYEFCFGSHVNQYHKLYNGSIVGDIIRLGDFSKNFDWLQLNQTNKQNYPLSSNVFYHEQYYEDGSICEISKKPRRVVAKIYCDESALSESIDLISEIETCVYEIHINSFQICSIPNFCKKSNNYEIKCSPVLSQDLHEKYTKKMQELEALKEDRSAKEKNELVKSKIETFESNANENEGEFQNQNDYFDLNNKIVDQLKEDVNYEKYNLNELIKAGENEEEFLRETNEKLEKADEIFKKVSNSFNELTDSDKLNGLKNDDLSQIQDTMFGNRNKDIFGADENEDILETKLTKLENLIETNNENIQNLKSLEEKILEKLNKANPKMVNIKGTQIKVKIITLDPTNQMKTLSEEETNSITSMITSLFEGDKDYEKLKKSKLNYNFVYDAENIDSLHSKTDLLKSEENLKSSSQEKEDNELEPIIFY